jgi:uncharacterized membrane protein YraQ (UPF0718 family)
MTPHKINWKTFSASLAAIGVVVIAYSDIIIEVAGKAAQDAEKGITVGTIGAIVYGINRKRRRKAFEQRDQRWEAKIDAIGEAVGWNLPASGSKKTEATSLKQCSKSSMEGNRMKAWLKRLGSRKFISLLVFTGINVATIVAKWMNVEVTADMLNDWTTTAQVFAQLLGMGLYVWVEGSIDKKTVKPDVVAPEGSATDGLQKPADINESNK